MNRARKFFTVLLILSQVLSYVPLTYATPALDEPTPTPITQPAPDPTDPPTEAPTEAPVVDPTDEPTEAPVVDPTDEPTEAPTVDPTDEPTEAPTVDPTDEPTEAPTVDPTDEPTQAPTVDPTDEPTEAPTVDPTDEPTQAPTDEPDPELTEEPTQAPTDEPDPELTEEPDFEVTEEPTAEATFEVMAPQTFCQMDIAGTPGNPFEYTLSAINVSPDISNFEWRIDGGPVVSTAQSFTQDFSGTGNGTYDIELTCIPDVLGPLVLTGQITINNVPAANFTVSPGFVGFGPFTVDLYSTSTGGIVFYEWEVVAQPVGDATVYPVLTGAAQDTAQYTLTGFGTYTIRLTVTDAAGQTDALQQDIAVNALPPQASFTISPNTGEAPLTVELQGVDEGQGPITLWQFDINNDGSIEYEYTYPDGGVPPAIPHEFLLDGDYTIRMFYEGPGGDGFQIRNVIVEPTGGDPAASFTWEAMGNVGNDVEYCFTNTSTGPVATSTWYFDGPPGTGTPVVDNSEVVCTVLSPGTRTIYLVVANATDTRTSQADDTVIVIGAPVAAFTASAMTITWGSTVDFTDTSDGTANRPITGWSWDFDGDGVEDSNEQNPAGIAIGNIGGAITLGANPVRLTVTGPGGSSYVEMNIVVQRLELACDFTGPLNVLPGAGAQTYTEDVTNDNGRTVTYEWNVVGPDTFTATGPSFTHAWSSAGSYTVTLTANAAADGASCSETQTVQVSYPPLDCQMTAPATVLPDGTFYDFDADVTGLSGRTIASYQWYVDGAAVPAPDGQGETFDYSWTVNPTTTDIRYVATASDGSFCEETVTRTAEWSELQCNITGGSDTPRPTMPSDGGTTQTYTYTADITGDDGRALTYTWLLNGVNVGSGASVTLDWDWTDISPPDFNLELQVEAAGSGGPFGCAVNPTRNISVTLPALACGLPIGDNTPALNENVTYTRNLTNDWGRPWATGDSATSTIWEFQVSDGAGGWTDVTPVGGQTGDGYPFLFDVPSETYRVRYSASVLEPADNCTSPWQTITVSGTDATFDCEGWNGGNLTPSNPDPDTYQYTVNIDNNAFSLPLQYTWVLTDANGDVRTWTTQPISTADGVITSPAFNGSWLGPIGDATLRVDVEDSSGSTDYTCSMQETLDVGTFSVGFDLTGAAANAIEVGQEVCLVNTSDTSHDGIDGLTYEWDFGTADNSLGTDTSTAQQPGCFTFDTQGAYTISLTGTNPSGSRTATQTLNIEVWNAQSVLINRTDNEIYAGNTLGFAASGTNINTYTWNFYTVPGGALVGAANRTGATMDQFFLDAGMYRAHVVGTGPLGDTEAELMFELIALGSIRAAFSPSQYAGVAPLDVCFTDNSVGTGLNRWVWNFGNGETLEYTDANIPAEICTTYTGMGQDYPVQLIVYNATSNAPATNLIHTYTLLESSATFTIQPQNPSRYCYTSVLPSGVSVTGWAFGDGGAAGAVDAPCHDYGASGTYIVRMFIIGPGGETGTITRTVVVNIGGGPAANLASDATCSADRTATFTFTNLGGAMNTPDEVRFINRSGQVFQTASLQLGAAGGGDDSQTYTFTNQIGRVRAQLVDNSGASTSTVCASPASIRVIGLCSGESALFEISNSGGAMSAAQSYEILDEDGNVLTSGSFSLGSGASPQQVYVPDARAGVTYRFVSDGLEGSFDVSHSCAAVVADAPTDEPTDEPAAIADAAGLTGSAGGSGILSLADVDWQGVPTCSIGCPVFRSYHSDESGDWEIYRIDGWDADTQETFRQNLSLHETATDMAPSISPNGEWVVFTSNRDTEPGEPENWEIYVAPTSGENPDAVRRVTFNTVAIDTDPVWGPSNFVAFETTRHGSWDLYAIDMSTGIEYRLTDGENDEINAHWSPDGSRLVYQSNDDGQWQIYELDLYTMTTRQLTRDDNVHVDPQYAPDGRRIAYRTYAAEGDNSRLAIMNTHSTDTLIVTDAAGDATNHAWSPSGAYIAYQSNLDGDLDIYVLEVATGRTRLITDNTIADYAPSWLCGDDRVIFTSDIAGNPDIFEADATPITDPAIDLMQTGEQLTFEMFNDIYPQVNPTEENASREGRTSLGIWGEQTSFLQPPVFMTPIDPALGGAIRNDWQPINACSIGG